MDPNILHGVPPGLLEAPAAALYQHLPGPTLIHLEGVEPRPLVVSVLQHGNETTGWEAVRRLLKERYHNRALPRSLILCIGNVAAARRGMRHLEDQPDFNRCWPGSSLPDSPWHRLFTHYTEYARAHAPIASIDIHNNTGMNPHYAAVNHADARAFALAALFARICVYFTRPDGVQAMAFGRFCPALTLECGQASEVHGTDHAMAFIERIFNMDALPTQPPPDLKVFQMVATVRVPAEIEFGFMPEAHTLALQENLDHLNFRDLPVGTRLARVNGHDQARLVATDHDGRDISDDCFIVVDGFIVNRKPVMPAMLTADAQVIRQDCLCYLMERMP